MPPYFFDTNDGANYHRDTEGDELADIETARLLALGSLSDMVGDKLTKHGDRRDFTVDVRDEVGKVVYTASLSLVARRFE